MLDGEHRHVAHRERRQRREQRTRVAHRLGEPDPRRGRDVDLPPPVPGEGGREEAAHDAGEGHPGGDVALPHAVEAARHASAREHHPRAEQDAAERRVDSERENVRRGRMDAQERHRHLPAHHQAESDGADGEPHQDALHVAAVTEQEEVTEGGREAEARALQDEAEGQPEHPVHRVLGVDGTGEHEHGTRQRPRAARDDHVARGKPPATTDVQRGSVRSRAHRPAPSCGARAVPAFQSCQEPS